MKKFLLAFFALLWLSSIPLLLPLTPVFGQCTGVFPSNTLCGNLSGSPQPPAAFPAAGTVVGPASSTSGDIAIWGNTGGTQLRDGGTSVTSLTNNITSNTIAMSGVVNVTSYGAKCDGDTDDTTAVSVAIATATASGNSGPTAKVYLPGPCVVSSTIT